MTMWQLKLLALLCALCALCAARPPRGPASENRLVEPPGVRRTRRSAVEQEQEQEQGEGGCERLRLCRLHAGAARSLLAAYQLYFVNRETARLWDHAPRSRADCEHRFSCDE